jgi:hypothetical protein
MFYKVIVDVRAATDDFLRMKLDFSSAENL